MKTYSNKLEFTVKHLSLGVLWSLISILMVILRRLSIGAINPLANQNREMYLKRPAMVLQNSLEQFIISSFGQISLISYIPNWAVVKVVPWINFLFFVGRISFTIGCPKYRTFGMLMTLAPNIGMTCFITLNWMRFAFQF